MKGAWEKALGRAGKQGWKGRENLTPLPFSSDSREFSFCLERKYEGLGVLSLPSLFHFFAVVVSVTLALSMGPPSSSCSRPVRKPMNSFLAEMPVRGNSGT